jgi:hypothetical protein
LSRVQNNVGQVLKYFQVSLSLFESFGVSL